MYALRYLKPRHMRIGWQSIESSRYVHTEQEPRQQLVKVRFVGSSERPGKLIFVTDNQSLRISKDGEYLVHKTTVDQKTVKEQYQMHWLRNECSCPKCIDPSTRQKLFQSSDLPLKPRIRQASILPSGDLSVIWAQSTGSSLGTADEHESLYAKDLIASSSSSSSWQPQSSMAPIPYSTWDGRKMAREANFIDYAEYMSEEQALWACLKSLGRHGLVFIRNVPDDVGSVAAVAERIGNLRDTFYGRTWDVQSVPDAKNIAFTDRALGLHMDLLYMKNPPGFQLLHCLKNTAAGGASVFSDSFRAVNILRQEEADMKKEEEEEAEEAEKKREEEEEEEEEKTEEKKEDEKRRKAAWDKSRAIAFSVLRRRPTLYHYRNAGEHYLHCHPTIEMARTGAGVNDPLTSPIACVNWSPPFEGPVPHNYLHYHRAAAVAALPARAGDDAQPQPQRPARRVVYSPSRHSSYRAHQRARKLFAALLEHPDHLFQHRMREGECVIFNNRRVLHARTEFDNSATGGDRWLRGCYVDSDVVLSRTRVLQEKLGGVR